MEIEIRKRYGFDLIFKADNVEVVEDVEERIYDKKEDGTTDYKRCKRDIKTSAIEQIERVLDDMIYYREAEFDSSQLIKRLFEKLPRGKRDELLTELTKDYIDDL